MSVTLFQLTSENWAKSKLLSHILKEERFQSGKCYSMEVQPAMMPWIQSSPTAKQVLSSLISLLSGYDFGDC